MRHLNDVVYAVILQSLPYLFALSHSLRCCPRYSDRCVAAKFYHASWIYDTVSLYKKRRSMGRGIVKPCALLGKPHGDLWGHPFLNRIVQLTSIHITLCIYYSTQSRSSSCTSYVVVLV